MRIRALCILILIFSLSACTPSLEQDTSWTARLDYENNQIVFPLDEYFFTQEESQILHRANLFTRVDCYRANGYSDIPYPEYEKPINNLYGAWNISWAQKYGFSSAPITEDSQKFSQVPQALAEKCAGEDIEITKLLSASTAGTDEGKFIGILQRQAANAAENSSEWAKLRKEQWACLESKNLSPTRDIHSWELKDLYAIQAGLDNKSLTKEQAKAEEIRIATIEAECSESLQFAQKLANLEASYQGPLIIKNQAKLNEIKEYKQSVLVKAKEIISTRQ
ncbi:MAG: hypothetical protein Q4P78_03285 [Rothia sp. (in: high G+C Gram-positive bacteria)]|uniref:hypothetical protein n=1 Tax=Rothia sp. (in: high G+C Gram-positive bacteria) TaxID=1885016 RepID=UPI0026DF82E7|nr:hypothetical protein [Rothia sp. (in: high G+C Gram-positive bacteria)]MDO5750212.1 hypothetical protein [Rothia sp. (in: high G+C Gram-positive bacteria)]